MAYTPSYWQTSTGILRCALIIGHSGASRGHFGGSVILTGTDGGYPGIDSIHHIVWAVSMPPTQPHCLQRRGCRDSAVLATIRPSLPS
jgi:hypothetical protein